jgi:hypothetical protein
MIERNQIQTGEVKFSRLFNKWLWWADWPNQVVSVKITRQKDKTETNLI